MEVTSLPRILVEQHLLIIAGSIAEMMSTTLISSKGREAEVMSWNPCKFGNMIEFGIEKNS